MLHGWEPRLFHGVVASWTKHTSEAFVALERRLQGLRDAVLRFLAMTKEKQESILQHFRSAVYKFTPPPKAAFRFGHRYMPCSPSPRLAGTRSFAANDSTMASCRSI